MLVLKNNYKEALPLFKESLALCDFLSFDCEMTGVMMDLKTDGTKYDTQQFRYHKNKEIVKKFDLIQVGITFYIKKENERQIQVTQFSEEGKNIEKTAEINVNLIQSEKVKSITHKFYLERTFTFNLFKNSKLRYLHDLYSNDSDFNLFSSLTTCHPATLKFLNDNHFDLNNIITNGLHHNKLSYVGKIKSALEKHIEEGKLPNSVIYLSKTNQAKVIETIKTIAKFLVFGKDNVSSASNKSSKMEKILKISNLNELVINYIISINLKKFVKISGFNLYKDKSDITSCTMVVEKSKVNLNSEEFMKIYQSFDNFCNTLTMEMIFNARYSQFIIESNNLDSVIEEELGFSKFIDLIIQRNLNDSPIPIIGHNIFFDLLFIYDKFIDDLPDKFYEFKKSLHRCFPIIYDNKFLTTQLAKNFENTKLDSLYKAFKKNKFDVFIDIKPDVVNGFALYSDFESNLAFHDAGFDSLITGRCFIFLIKAVENNFETENRKGISHHIGNEELKSIKSVQLIEGFVDFTMKNCLISEFTNRTILSMIEEPFDICNFDTEAETYEDFEKKEKTMELEVYKYVYAVILAKEDKSIYLYTIYEIAKLFENSAFNISVIKIDDNVAFIEFLPQDQNYQNEEEVEDLLKQVIGNARKASPLIENVLPYCHFISKYNEIIKF